MQTYSLQRDLHFTAFGKSWAATSFDIADGEHLARFSAEGGDAHNGAWLRLDFALNIAFEYGSTATGAVYLRHGTPATAVTAIEALRESVIAALRQRDRGVLRRSPRTEAALETLLDALNRIDTEPAR